MLKILQARLQQYVNRELPDVQAGFQKAEEPEIKLPTSAGSWKKQESSFSTSSFRFSSLTWLFKHKAHFYLRACSLQLQHHSFI